MVYNDSNIDLPLIIDKPASTGERIAAAFMLNIPQYLPNTYTDIVEAWDRLDDDWQEYVRQIKRDHRHKIQGLE